MFVSHQPLLSSGAYTMAVFVIGFVLALVDHATEERLLGGLFEEHGRWRG